MRLLAMFLIVGCGHDRAAPPDDAATSSDALLYEVVLVPGEPPTRPSPSIVPVSYIDGVAAKVLDHDYPSAMMALATQHEVELRLGSTTIARRTLVISPDSCLGHVPDASYYTQTVCTYDSGDLRAGGDEATGSGDGCISDSPCLPRCNPVAATGCAPDEHCTSIVTSVDPFASHLGCAQVGPGRFGDACTLISDAYGLHDDCGAGLLCVADICHATCSPSDTTSCAGCTFVPGHAPELGVCP